MIVSNAVSVLACLLAIHFGDAQALWKCPVDPEPKPAVCFDLSTSPRPDLAGVGSLFLVGKGRLRNLENHPIDDAALKRILLRLKEDRKGGVDRQYDLRLYVDQPDATVADLKQTLQRFEAASPQNAHLRVLVILRLKE